jgi:hypothetical protein
MGIEPRSEAWEARNKNRDYVMRSGAGQSDEPVDIYSDSEIHFRPRRMVASARGVRRPSGTASTRRGSSSGV